MLESLETPKPQIVGVSSEIRAEENKSRESDYISLAKERATINESRKEAMGYQKPERRFTFSKHIRSDGKIEISDTERIYQDRQRQLENYTQKQIKQKTKRQKKLFASQWSSNRQLNPQKAKQLRRPNGSHSLSNVLSQHRK